MIYPWPADVIENANVPPTPTVASTTAPVPLPPADPTPTLIVFVVNEVIPRVAPAAGSVALGYGCSVKKSSSEQVKIRLSVAIWMVSVVSNPWFGIVSLNTPVWDVKSALVGVNGPPVLAVMLLFEDLTNLCS